MINKFSAFFSSAAFVKLNDPVMTVSRSMIIILLCAMACLSSIKVGMPTLDMKVAAVYFSFRWLLSSIASTLMPLLKASVRAFAIEADVNEYAWTRISDLAALISWTIVSVHSPLGLKQTFVMSAWKANDAVATKLRIRNDKTVVVILFIGFSVDMKNI